MKFLDWLNSLSPRLKFTIVYGDNCQYLATTVDDVNGILKTKIYSKPTVARRLKKLNSEESDYEASKPVYNQYLLNRGYSEEKINAAFLKYDQIDRKTLYQENPHTSNKGKTYPLITEFNPKLPNVSKVLQKHKYVLNLDTLLTSIIHPQKIFASFRQPSNIKSLLTRSGFKDNEHFSKLINTVPSNANLVTGRSKSCNKCKFCKLYLIDTDNFKSYESTEVFYIDKIITCLDKGVIYLIKDLCCRRLYTGSTINAIPGRWSAYKYHIKTAYKPCKIAHHVAQSPMSHDITLKDGLDNIDNHLQHQFQVILIDKVDLSNCINKEEKLKLVKECEGKWIDKLKTLEKFGGFNKRDETKIAARGN